MKKSFERVRTADQVDRRLAVTFGGIAFVQWFLTALGYRRDDHLLFWLWTTAAVAVAAVTILSETYLQRRQRLGRA